MQENELEEKKEGKEKENVVLQYNSLDATASGVQDGNLKRTDSSVRRGNAFPHNKTMNFTRILREKILNSDLEWWKVILGRLPKVLLNAGFAVLSAVFAFSVVATPVLSIGGVVLTLVFASRAADEMVKIVNRSIETGKNEVLDITEVPDNARNNSSDNSVRSMKLSSINWKKPGLWKYLSSCLLGIGLILFGIALFIMPASFLGALAGLGLFAKIGAIVAGFAFFVKGYIDYAKFHCGDASKFERNRKIDAISNRILHCAKSYIRHILDCLLYSACAVLGIAALATGGFGIMPLVFAGVFAVYAVSSLLRMDGRPYIIDCYGKQKIARCLEAIALGVMGLALIVGGVFFAPALLGAFGLTATLFTKIASIFMGVFFAGAGLFKILFGARLKFLDSRFNGELFGDVSFESFDKQSIIGDGREPVITQGPTDEEFPNLV